MKSSEGDWTLLNARYEKGSLGVSYMEFLDDVSNEEKKLGEKAARGPDFGEAPKVLGTTIPLSSTFAGGIPPTLRGVFDDPLHTQQLRPRDVTDVLARLRGAVERRRLHTSDLFQDYDSLRKGTVTHTQFRRALSSNGLDVTDEEFEHLLSAFEVGDKFDYTAFSNELHLLPNTRFGDSTRAPLRTQVVATGTIVA